MNLLKMDMTPFDTYLFQESSYKVKKHANLASFNNGSQLAITDRRTDGPILIIESFLFERY